MGNRLYYKEKAVRKAAGLILNRPKKSQSCPQLQGLVLFICRYVDVPLALRCLCYYCDISIIRVCVAAARLAPRMCGSGWLLSSSARPSAQGKGGLGGSEGGWADARPPHKKSYSHPQLQGLVLFTCRYVDVPLALRCL